MKYSLLHVDIDRVSNKARRHRIKALPGKIDLLDALDACFGEIRPACRKTHLSVSNVMTWRRKDAVFAEYVREMQDKWRGTNGNLRCRCCAVTKPVDEFTFRGDRPGNIRKTCKSCKRVQGRLSYKRNKVTSFFRHKASRTKSRSQNLRVPCNVTAEYLRSIWTGVCPVFGMRLEANTDRNREDAPELDRIIPARGYTMGNVVWLSRRANRLKNNVSAKELRQLIEWLETVISEEKCAA